MSVFKNIGIFLRDLVEKHKFFRRLTLIWALMIITYTVCRVFGGYMEITGAVATALATVVGILATVITFYVTTRNKQDTHE